jgi:hypothetical protein
MRISHGAVIVLVPGHLRFLDGLVENLNESSRRFDQIVVVASGFSSMFRVKKSLSSLICDDLTLVRAPLGSAGKNRNLGWRLIDTELVSFLDSDDLYGLERNVVIGEIYLETQFDLFLHGFTSFDDGHQGALSLGVKIELPLDRLVRRDKLSSRRPRNRSLELKGQTPSTNLRFRDPAAEFEVQHAHATVRTVLREGFEFHEVFGIRNEDGVLAQDVLDAGREVVLSPLKLSGYRQGARAKPRRFLAMCLSRVSRTGSPGKSKFDVIPMS